MSNDKVAQLWQLGVAKFEALELRERVLVALTLLAAVWMIWDLLLYAPIASSQTKVENGLSNTGAKLTVAVQEQRLLSNHKAKDPNVALKSEQEVLRDELKILETDLREAIARFVEPEKMPQLLADLMRQHQGLQFKRVTRLPTEPIEAAISQELLAATQEGVNAEPVADVEALSAELSPSLYRHPIELEFEGSYFDVLAYLHALELSDWRLNWRNLEYVVKDYPLARVTVQVDTLSRRKEWLGV